MKRTGTLNAVTENVEIDIGPEDGSVVAQITGTWVGTLTPEVQMETDGPWKECRWLGTDDDAASETTTANGNFQFLRVAGAQKARVYMSAYTSGDAAVTLRGARGMGAHEVVAGAVDTATETTLAAVESAVDGLEANTAPSAGPLAGAEVVVTTAGTRVRFTASDVPCKAVLICAKKAAGANTGNVYIGNSGVTSSNAIPWAPGSIIEWEVDNVNKLWVDAATNGDAIVYQPIARAS